MNVAHSVSTRQFMLIELIISYALRMEGHHMYKVGMYEGLVADLRDDGFTVRFCTAEMGTRGLVSKSTYNALKQLGPKGAIRSLSEAAEKAS